VATFVIARSARVGAGRLIYPSGTEGGAASRNVVDLADPGRNGTRAIAPLTAQEVLEADDKMRIAPVEPAAMAPRPLPPPHSTSNTLISSPHLHVHPIPTASTTTTKSVVDKKRRRHVYIGKWQKSWGHLISVPDPDPGLGRGSGRNGRKRKRAVRVRPFVGSENPILSSQKRANKKVRKNSKRGRGRKKKGLEMKKNEQRQIASSLPPSRSSSIAAGDEGGANQNAASYEEHDPDADVEKGDWPGEYGHPHAHDELITVLPPAVTVSGVVATTISPEELERAIGAAFAAGMQY